MEMLSTLGKATWQLFLEMSPYLLLGFLFAGILHVLIPKSFITKQIGKRSIWSNIKATILGVPLPLCSCGVIPTGISFHKNGASKGASTSFLISTPQTGIDSILITSSLMNWPWAIARPIIALITGVFGGVLTDRLTRQEEIVSQTISKSNTKNNNKHWFLRIFSYAFLEFLPDISRQLLIGILIAVCITVFIPPTLFSTYLTHPFLNMVVILLASVPFYVCATGSVPIASSLLLLGVSPGAVLVFLMAGPATNAATISVLWNSLGKKATLAYLISIIGGALAFGLLIDYIAPQHWFTLNNSNATHVHGSNSSIIAILSAVLLIGLIILVETKKLIPLKQQKMQTSTSYKVIGMTCNHCKHSVETNLQKLPTVEDIQVDLQQKLIHIKGTASSKEIKSVLDDLGFVFKGVQ